MEPTRTRLPKKTAVRPIARSQVVRRVTRAAAAKPAARTEPRTPSAEPSARSGGVAEGKGPRPSNGRYKWYIALGVAGLVLLTVCTVLALTGAAGDLERRVFQFVNHAHFPGWVAEQIAKPVSNAVWGMVFLVAALLVVPKFRLLAWQYAVAAGSAYTAAFIVEHLVGRARPVALEGYNAVMRAAQDGYGFPSGHVAVLTALTLTAWPYIVWPWRIVLLAFVGAEAWSRVFLGVHAPLDVAGGAAAAAVVVAIIHLLPAKIRRIFRLAA